MKMKRLIEQAESECLTEGWVYTTLGQDIVEKLLPEFVSEIKKPSKADKMTAYLMARIGSVLSDRLEPKDISVERAINRLGNLNFKSSPCLLYTSDAADE